MTSLETLARLTWQAWGAYAKWTFCTGCQVWLYCRSKDGSQFFCLDCHDQR